MSDKSRFQHGILRMKAEKTVRMCSHAQGERCEGSGLDGTEADFHDRVQVAFDSEEDLPPLAEVVYEAAEPQGWNQKSPAYYQNYDRIFGSSNN